VLLGRTNPIVLERVWQGIDESFGHSRTCLAGKELRTTHFSLQLVISIQSNLCIQDTSKLRIAFVLRVPLIEGFYNVYFANKSELTLNGSILAKTKLKIDWLIPLEIHVCQLLSIYENGHQTLGTAFCK
jgi:hypothetical protein